MAHVSPRTDRVYCQASHVEQSYCQGGVALWDTQADTYYHLNDTGAEIWQHLDHPSTIASLVRKLSRDFDASPATLLQSVETLLKELTRNGLISSVRA